MKSNRNNPAGYVRTTAALAAMLLFSAGACAASAEIYGVIDTGFLFQNQSPDYDSVTGSAVSAKSTLEMKSGTNKGSRWGIRGVEELTGEVSIKFILENGFGSETGEILFGDRLFGRQATLSVTGPYGELAFGRMGALTSGAGNYALAAWLTPFDTGLGNWSTAASNYMFGFQRLDNALLYISPKFAGWQLHAQYSLQADIRLDHSSEDGVQNGEEGKASADRYWAVAATYKQGPVDFVAILDSYNWSSDIAANSGYQGVARDFDDSLALTAGGSYNFGRLKAYAGVQWFQNGWKNWIGGGHFKINTAADTQGAYGQDRYIDGVAVVGGVDFDLGPGRTGIGVAYSDTKSSLKTDDSRGKRYGLSLIYTYPLSKTTALYWIGSWMHDEHKNIYNAEHNKIGQENTVNAFESAVGLYMWF